MNFGLGPKGFKRKRYDDVILSMETRAKNLFGEDINLSERSPLGLFLRVVAWNIAVLWQLAEKVYNSAFVDTAEGNQLDHVARIPRRLAEKAAGEILIQGDNGITIPTGFLIATEDDITFETTIEVIISVDLVLVPIRAIEPGTRGNVPANTITEVVNPIIGVDSVNNGMPTSGGRNKETDFEFRERYKQSVAKGGASTLDSIRASLLDVPGVRAARVVENDTMTIDSEGRSPKSVSCYVLGGQPENIAKAIFKTKAGGIEPYGAESITVFDASGEPKTIKFTYADEVAIYINVVVTKNNQYPLDGDEQVRAAVIKYIGGVDQDGSIYAGLGMGQDVVILKISTAVDSIKGVEDAEIEVSIDNENFGTGNISIEQAEVAETDYTKVVVTSA